jgi:hypothetical protein
LALVVAAAAAVVVAVAVAAVCRHRSRPPGARAFRPQGAPWPTGVYYNASLVAALLGLHWRPYY